MITGGDLRQSRLDVGYKTFTISPWIPPWLLNKDAYAHLGSFNVFYIQSNLISKIRKAWSNALSGDYECCAGLVHIPENPIYYLDANNLNENVYRDFIYRCSYMAKHDTKLYGNGFRCFGCSQG